MSSREGEEDKLSFLKGERYIDISEKRGGEMDKKATGKWLPPTQTRVNSFLFLNFNTFFGMEYKI